MTPVTSLLAIVLVFGGLIFIHEFGHFLAAKRAGVLVNEFALGFGPRLAAFRRGDTVYALRLLPLGGFVRLAGMYPPRDAGEVPPPGRGFNDKTVGQRMGIAAAGPLMNVVLAAVLLTLVLAAVGVPMPVPTVDAVEPGRPAAEAGLRPGDAIVAVDGRPVREWLQVQQAIAASPGRPLALTLRRDGRELELTVVPDEVEGRGFLGIRPEARVRRLPPLAAVVGGVRWTGDIVTMTVQGLAAAVRGAGGADILGPVGIGQQIGEASRHGLRTLLILAAVLSVNLGLLNLLPFPALDGSRLAFLFLEAVRGRPVDPERENWIHAVGFALLMLLLLVVTYRDLLRLQQG